MAMRSALLAAVGVALGVAAFAPAAAQEPVVNQTEVTLVGCIESEQAYRTRTGVKATGVGENDIALTGAKAAAGSATPAGVSGDFSLTGRLEAQLSTEMGRPVEIVGFIEDEATHEASMTPVTLRRLFVKLWQPAAGTCS